MVKYSYLALAILFILLCSGVVAAGEFEGDSPRFREIQNSFLPSFSLGAGTEQRSFHSDGDRLFSRLAVGEEDLQQTIEPSEQVLTPIPVYKPVLFSAALPGAGQLYRGQKRGFAYIAAEVVGLTSWAFFRNEGNNNKDEYIDYARVNARETVAAHDPWWGLIQSRINPELMGDWDYYEHMSNYRRSGRFDRDLNNDYTQTGNIRDLDPETEYTDSFNFRQWRIARINYFQQDPENPDPDALMGTSADTVAAKEFYAATATNFEFAWDWGPPEEFGTANQNEFKRIIDDANSAFRRASFSLGVLLANHVVSVIDSYISVKTYNSKIGGKDGLGFQLTPDSVDENGPRAKFSIVRRF
jgi:hypothetical protein